MSDTDFSISDPTFVQFDYNGWPDADKSQLESSARALTGVTEVNQAGARSSIHVHFDPAVIDRDELISAVNEIAVPIVARLNGSPAGLGRLSNDLLLDGGPAASPGPESPAVENTNQLQAANLTTGSPEFGSPTLEVHDAVSASITSSPELSAREIIRSSAWTGNKTMPEQIAIIRAYAPLALAGLDALAAAIEEKRYNDEVTQDALRILKELRTAIDDLIQAAEGSRPLSALWELVERRTFDLMTAAKTGAKVIVGAPIVGLGAAYAISLLTGDAITGQMVATMAGGSVMAGALAKNGKK